MFEWGDLDIPTPPHSEIGAISECYVGNVHDVMFLFLLCVLFDFILDVLTIIIIIIIVICHHDDSFFIIIVIVHCSSMMV